MCEGAYLVRANLDEALLVGEVDGAAEDAAAALCALGARLAVVSVGAEGAVMGGAAEGREPAPAVDVVSPLGAGDAQLGALCAGLARLGWPAERAAEALPGAVAAGSRACESWGAIG
jgi:ribokinase